jgi:hypothetical protein
VGGQDVNHPTPLEEKLALAVLRGEGQGTCQALVDLLLEQWREEAEAGAPVRFLPRIQKITSDTSRLRILVRYKDNVQRPTSEDVTRMGTNLMEWVSGVHSTPILVMWGIEGIDIYELPPENHKEGRG